MKPDSTEAIRQARLSALRKIQFTLTRETKPLIRSCGLSAEEFDSLRNNRLVEVRLVADEGADLDRYRVVEILPAGSAILANTHLEPPSPVQVVVLTPPKSVWKKLYENTRSGLWDLVKIALGALLGWLLK